MPKLKRNSGSQGDLFVAPAVLPAGSLDLSKSYKKTVSRALKRASTSRAGVADGATYLSGRKVTESNLNDYTAETKIHQTPAVLVPVLYAMTGDKSLIDDLVEPVGLKVVGPYEQKLIRLKEAELEAELLAEEIAELRTDCLKELRRRRK